MKFLNEQKWMVISVGYLGKCVNETIVQLMQKFVFSQVHGVRDDKNSLIPWIQTHSDCILWVF